MHKISFFFSLFQSKYSKRAIETFQHLRERDAGDNNHLCEELIVKPEGPQHVSRTSSNNDSNSDENTLNLNCNKN